MKLLTENCLLQIERYVVFVTPPIERNCKRDKNT